MEQIREQIRDQIRELSEDILNIEFVNGVISGPRTKGSIIKIKIRPVMKKEALLFQCESYTNTQVFHKNMEKAEAAEAIAAWMKEFTQMQFETKQSRGTVRISKKGKVTIHKKNRVSEKQADLSHDRRKQYILEEGTPVPFLEDLGVMTREGLVRKHRYDKFRQINRFLEFIEDILPQLPSDREVTVLDFGCGKSYLTFAMYYYMHVLKGYDIRIMGLDLKKEVIDHCSQLSRSYGYEKLEFLVGDIADYRGMSEVDMVVTLHACDTATDIALAKAVEWNARVILSVPCCQHELNGQMRNDVLEPVLKYGLIKERMAALLTDALRAEYLETRGYDAQILEFIDMEHTPKNILIRAVKTGKHRQAQEKQLNQIQTCCKAFHIKPSLGDLLYSKGE